MNMEKIREEFERINSDRHWFVAGGRVDSSLDEGFEYEDYTTDMCWTCWVGSRAVIDIVLPLGWGDNCINPKTGQPYEHSLLNSGAVREAIESHGIKVTRELASRPPDD